MFLQPIVRVSYLLYPETVKIQALEMTGKYLVHLISPTEFVFLVIAYQAMPMQRIIVFSNTAHASALNNRVG